MAALIPGRAAGSPYLRGRASDNTASSPWHPNTTKTAPTFQQGVVPLRKQEWCVFLPVVSPQGSETYSTALRLGRGDCGLSSAEAYQITVTERRATFLFNLCNFPGVINQLTFKLDEMAYALVWRTDGGLGENCFCRLATNSTDP